MISYMSCYAYEKMIHWIIFELLCLKTGFGVACWSLFRIEGGSTLAGN